MDQQSSAIRMRRYYRTVVPLFKKPKVAAYMMIILSFLAIAFFGAFAIRPTIVTILGLRKHIEDQTAVSQAMSDKIENINRARAEYATLKVNNGLTAVMNALPPKPQAVTLLGKMNRLIADNKINITILQFSVIPLVSPKDIPTQATPLQFTMTAKGSYDNIVKFISLTTTMDRIITIDSADITNNSSTTISGASDLTVGIQGRAYVLWEGKGAVNGG